MERETLDGSRWCLNTSKTRRINAVATLIGAVLFNLASMDASAKPFDNWDVEGEHGELVVFGTMREGACTLDLASSWQEIQLESVPLTSLVRAGDRSDPMKFSLKLNDCVRTSGRSVDHYLGNFVWGSHQPVVRVTFNGVADKSSPELLKLSGIDGVGLRMLDSKNNTIRLGQKGTPVILAPGGNELNYRVALERTTDSIIPGAYTATVNFTLSYD